ALDDDRALVVGLTRESEVVIPVAVHQRALHVGLADESDLVAVTADEIGDDWKPVRHLAVLIVDRTCGVGVEAAQDRGARGQAQGVDAERVREYRAFAAYAIDVGSLQQSVAGERRLIPTGSFSEKEHQIGPRACGPTRERHRQQLGRDDGGTRSGGGLQELATTVRRYASAYAPAHAIATRCGCAHESTRRAARLPPPTAARPRLSRPHPGR